MKGEQYAEDERQEIDFCFRFQSCGELVGDGLKKRDGGLLSWQNHGSPFCVKVELFGNFKLGNLAKLVLPNCNVLCYDTALSH